MSRHMLVLKIMQYAYTSARRCGESAEVAEREAFEAAQWVKDQLKQER
jgi:hypothetical protein